MTKLLDVGIYEDLAERDYHALPYLGSSGLKVLATEAPALFRYQADNPEDTSSRVAEIGTAAHLLTLQPERRDIRLVVIDDDGYRSNASKKAREEAMEAGKEPILSADLPKAEAIARAIRERYGEELTGGRAELTLVWDDPQYGVRCKARIDYQKPRLLIDLKTTSSIAPASFSSRIHDNGHHIQAPHYMRGWSILTGEAADWMWIAAMNEPPYLVTHYLPSGQLLQWGEKLMKLGLRKYRDCAAFGQWPGYAGGSFIDLPGHALWKLEQAEEAGDFTEPKPKTRAAAAWASAYRPLDNKESA